MEPGTVRPGTIQPGTIRPDVMRLGSVGATCAIVLAAALSGAPAMARAQASDVVPPRVGETVRVRSPLVDGRGYRVECRGTVTSVAGDTLVLEGSTAANACPRRLYPADSVQRLHVARGHRGSRLAHAAIGLVGGAVFGGILGRAVAGDGCRVSGCDDGGLAIAILTVVGTIGGGTVGLVVGALVPAGPRWVPVYGEPTVRVASDRAPAGVGVRVGF